MATFDIPPEGLSSIDQFSSFLSNHKTNSKSYLVKSISPGKYYTAYIKPEFISDYAVHRFKEFEKVLKTDASSPNKNLFETATIIYYDYKREYNNFNRLQKMFYSFLSFVGVHQSNEEVEKAFQAIQRSAKTSARIFGGKPPENVEARIFTHRNPQAKDYAQAEISRQYFKKKVEEDLLHRKDELEAMQPQQRAIEIANIKEKVCREVYKEHLPENIHAGYYDPEIIPQDIAQLLGKVSEITHPIVSQQQLTHFLEEEVDNYKGMGKLNDAQAHRLRHDAKDVANLYLKAFPGKSYLDAFYLVRDLVRLATYQEYYDKSSFNGSDHGSKHIHNNILGSLSLHKAMKKEDDYTVKDQFVEELVHFYHDIGYTVGLAGKDFDCCKDHPFIGAKMIEFNREYFLYYLDEASYEALHDSVLCHAIMRPDLTAREKRDGLHPNMIRAVTSISDACAVTYDRKTQEFWEQPRALIALARIKSFLVLFPEYSKKLGDKIVDGLWEGYDSENPLDVMAYQVFVNTRLELLAMVEDYDIPQEKRKLFRQAIEQQFNAFKANITLGQYGAVLAGLDSVPNEERGNEDALPAYVPRLTLGVSIAYGVLKDLFGADQANDSFKKLVEEFSGNMKDLEKQLEVLSGNLGEGRQVEDIETPVGIGHFRLMGRFVKTPGEVHRENLDRNLSLALSEIDEVFKDQQISLSKRAETLKLFDQWYEGFRQNQTPLFSEFVIKCILPILTLPGEHGTKIDTSTNDNLQAIEKFMSVETVTQDDYVKVRRKIALLFMTDKEYAFMRGPSKSSRIDLMELK